MNVLEYERGVRQRRKPVKPGTVQLRGCSMFSKVGGPSPGWAWSFSHESKCPDRKEIVGPGLVQNWVAALLIGRRGRQNDRAET